jgi:hypothetical protein
MGKDDSVSGEKHACMEENTVLMFSDLSGWERNYSLDCEILYSTVCRPWSI